MNDELKIKKFLEWKFNDFTNSIEFHKTLNQPYDPIGDSSNEMLHGIMYGTRCTGSAGAGWDTKDNGESKYSNFLQSRTCKNCKERVMFFLETCPECGGCDFKDSPKDARWGINSKTHLKYVNEIKGYRLSLFEPIFYEPHCRIFKLRSWYIETKNDYLNEYAFRQNKNKSKNINLQPLKQDFYFSSPCKHLEVTIDVGNNDITIDYFNINNRIPETIPDEYKNRTMESIMENKKFGKKRGNVNRN
jgi:hypothetical protein